MTSNIDLDLLASVFDLRSGNIWRGTHIYFWFWAFWCIKHWNRLKNVKVTQLWQFRGQLRSPGGHGMVGMVVGFTVNLTSNIDLDRLAAVFDLRSWNMWRGTHIYILFWAFWCIKRWNRLKNGQVSEIDLQYWPRPPSCRVWPPILKHVQGNPHLYFILSILVY